MALASSSYDMYDCEMINAPKTIAELIGKWPTVREFASDIECGLEAAFQMKKRNRISPHHWARVISAAEARRIAGVNYGWLAARYSAPRRARA